MRIPRRRTRLLAAVALAAAGGAALALSGPAPAVDETKPYRLSLTATPDTADARLGPSEGWAGATPLVTITITNDAKTQSIGSANIDIPGTPDIALNSAPTLTTPGGAPAPGTVTARNGVLELRDLQIAPGGSLLVNVEPRIPCAPEATYTWTTVAKQANDFNGTGNLFDLVSAQPVLGTEGTCSLVFPEGAGPALTKKTRNITRGVYGVDFGAAGVAVEVRDGGGSGPVTWWNSPITLTLPANPAGGTLSGVVSGTPAAGTGRVTFASDGTGPQIDRSYDAYQLRAGTTGVPSTLSLPFAVSDDGGKCPASGCRGSASTTRTSADLTAPATSQSDVLTLFVGSPGLPALDCPNYTETNDVVQFDVTKVTDGSASGGLKTLTYTILNPSRNKNGYQICFRRPGTTFVTRDGTNAPAVGTITVGTTTQTLYQGLLPDCPRFFSGTLTPAPPCVADRQQRSGTVTLTVVAPAGDPWLRG